MKSKKLWLGMLAMALVLGMMVVGCSDDYNCSTCRDGNHSRHIWQRNYTYVVDFQIINDSTLEVLIEGVLEARNNGERWSDTFIRRDIREQLGFVDGWGQPTTDARTVGGIDQRLLFLGITETYVCRSCGR